MSDDYMREYGFGAIVDSDDVDSDEDEQPTREPIAYPEQEETFLVGGLGAAARGKRNKSCAQDDERLLWARINVCVDYRAQHGAAVGVRSIGNSRDVASFLRQVTPADRVGTEFFAVLVLNAKNEPVGVYEAHKGGISMTVVEVGVILQPVIQLLAPAFIICHNHPSGQPQPSAEDAALTKRIDAAAKIMGLKLLDHIILASGNNDYYSFLDSGRFD
jgi:DNA repair protein RadC